MSCFSDGAAGQESACIAGDTGEVGDRLNSWVRKMPWRRRWQPASVFLPGSFHGQRSMAGYSPNYHNKSDTTEWLNTQYWIIIQSTNKWTNQFSSVQSLSHVRLFATPWIAACQASLSITNSHSLLKLMSIKSVMPSSHLILCRPLLLLPQSFPALRSFLMSQLFALGGQSIWSFSFSISPSNEHPGLISFRMEWLDLLAVQGTLKSLLQHHSSKAAILWHSAFFTMQFSHPYMTTGKTIALTRWTFIGKVMSLLLNMLSR